MQIIIFFYTENYDSFLVKEDLPAKNLNNNKSSLAFSINDPEKYDPSFFSERVKILKENQEIEIAIINEGEKLNNQLNQKVPKKNNFIQKLEIKKLLERVSKLRKKLNGLPSEKLNHPTNDLLLKEEVQQSNINNNNEPFELNRRIMIITNKRWDFKEIDSIIYMKCFNIILSKTYEKNDWGKGFIKIQQKVINEIHLPLIIEKYELNTSDGLNRINNNSILNLGLLLIELKNADNSFKLKPENSIITEFFIKKIDLSEIDEEDKIIISFQYQ